MNLLVEPALSLCAVGALLAAAHLVGRLFESVRLPRVIGEIFGGVLLGPSLLSHLYAGPMSTVFAENGWSRTVLPLVSQVGLVVLMFMTGAHLRLVVGRKEGKLISYLAIGGIVLPFLAGLLAVQSIDAARLIGPANNLPAFVLVFATAIAIASIPVISRIMLDLGIIDTPFARIVISTAVIDDLVLYAVLAVALSLVQTPGLPENGLPAWLGLGTTGVWPIVYHVLATIGFTVVVLFAGPLLLRSAFRWRTQLLKWDNGFVVQAAALCIVTTISTFLSINPIFGALAAGIVVGRTGAVSGHPLARTWQRVGQQVFVPLYFALVGFKLDLIHHFDAIFFLSFIGFACLVKASSIYLSARMAGQTNAMALNLAAALNARGGPGIVLATLAYEAQIINESFFAILVLTAIVTSLVAGAWLGLAIRFPMRWRPHAIERLQG